VGSFLLLKIRKVTQGLWIYERRQSVSILGIPLSDSGFGSEMVKVRTSLLCRNLNGSRRKEQQVASSSLCSSLQPCRKGNSFLPL
jgi:hypothetical protein